MKKRTARDLQVRHRLSGAALLNLTRRGPAPHVLALDVQPGAGDGPSSFQGRIGGELPADAVLIFHDETHTEKE